MPEMNISSKIDEILKRRKEKATALRTKMDQVRDLERTLNGVSGLVKKTDSIEDPGMQKMCRDLFKQAVIPKTVIKEIRELQATMQNIVGRFERDSLNIATIGRARQGKSTLLQAIGNLDNKVIPAFDAGDCTGAVSIICNDPSMLPGEVRAVLNFRTKQEMVDIVRGYIREIDPNYLQSHTVEYEDIEFIELDELEEAIEPYVKEGDVKRPTMLAHLRRIVEDFDGSGDSDAYPVKGLCGSAPIVLTDPDEIQKYVAQNNGQAVGSPLRENYYSYLAVKQADIYCRFRADVGKLVMVDTIGIGDTQMGIEDSMMDTVENKCDAAIVMTKPAAGIRTEDLALYDSLRERFAKRDLKKWLFYLANAQKGFNDNAVDTFVRDIHEKNFAVAFCKKISCIDKEQVQNEFLIPLLEILLDNLDEVDNLFIKEINDKCAALRTKLIGIIAAFPDASSMSPGAMMNIQVNNLGRQCYKEMKISLAKQRAHWYKNRNKPNMTLWNRVKDILNNLENILPGAEELQSILEDAGGLAGFQLWEVPLNYLRNEITDQFISIDQLMEEETLEFKNNLVRDLYHSLKNLAGEVKMLQPEKEASGDVDMAAWLWDVMEPLLRDNEKYKQIYSALQFLNQFEFNVRAQLIREVRNQLQIINPLTPDYYMQPNDKFDIINAGEAVHFYMTSRLAILEDGLRFSLAKLNQLPNQAFYAAAEEFYDRMTFASDFSNGRFVDMGEIWGEFFTQYSQLLWATEMGRYKLIESVMQEYTQYCQLINEKMMVLA